MIVKFDGCVVLVFGFGWGIGCEIVFKLVLEGVCVVVNDLDVDFVNEIVEVICVVGGEVVVCVGSVIEDGFVE